MAIAYWVGPSAGRPKSGSFETASNWSNTLVPDAATDLYLPNGRFTVTMAVTRGLGSVSIGSGATLRLQAPQSDDFLSIQLVRDSVNFGTINLVGSTIAIDTVMLNFGTISGRNTLYGAQLLGGTTINAGLITTESASGGFVINTTLMNEADGVLRSQPGGLLLVTGTVTNHGTVSADGGTLRFDGFGSSGTVTNLSGGKLVDGDWSVRGGGFLGLAGTRIVALSGEADVVIDGATSSFVVAEAGTDYTLESSLRRIDEEAALHLLGGRSFASTNAFDVRGTLELGGGAFSAQDISAEDGARILGFGTITGRADLQGEISATGRLVLTDRADIRGALTGSGELVFNGDNTVISANTTITVAALTIGGDTRLAADLTYGGLLTVNDATLDLGSRRFRVTGAFDLDDATVTGSTLADLRGTTTSMGDSIVRGNVANTGTVAVADGVLTIEGRVSGRGGIFTIGDDATLAFGVGASIVAAQSISFATGDGTLAIGAAAGFKAMLASFAAGDAIEIAGVAGATVRWVADADGVGGTLRILDDGGTISLRFADGEYARRDFVLADSGDGGATLTVTGSGGIAQAGPAAFASIDVPAVDHVMEGPLHGPLATELFLLA